MQAESVLRLGAGREYRTSLVQAESVLRLGLVKCRQRVF